MNMAQLWLPKAERVHAHALRWVNNQPIRLYHLTLSPQAAETEARLLEHGMQRLAHLAHLTGSSHRRLVMNEARPLSLQPFGEFSQTQQLALLAAVGTIRLARRTLGVRVIDRVQSAGSPGATALVHRQLSRCRGWCFAAGATPVARPLGVYIDGLTPEWRGIGLGRALLNSALELAQQAGFKQYAQQRLLAWKGGGERSEAPH